MPNNACVETFPRRITYLGLTTSICSFRKGMQSSISSLSGTLFFGGKNWTTLVMYARVLFIPALFSISSSSLPLLPIKGRRIASSSAPGAWPIIINLVSRRPSPGTKSLLNLHPSLEGSLAYLSFISDIFLYLFMYSNASEAILIRSLNLSFFIASSHVTHSYPICS